MIETSCGLHECGEDSIEGDGSRPVSRVLSWTVIHLGYASPHTSSNLPGNRAGRTRHCCLFLYLVLLQAGFTLPPTLPPARCALTGTFSPLPPGRMPHASDRRTPLHAAGLGGMFSVALSVGLRPPGVTWRPALRSPDFPPCENALPGDPDGAPLQSDCPADSRKATIKQADAQGKPSASARTRRNRSLGSRRAVARNFPE